MSCSRLDADLKTATHHKAAFLYRRGHGSVARNEEAIAMAISANQSCIVITNIAITGGKIKSTVRCVHRLN